MEVISINSEQEMLDFSSRIAKKSSKKDVYFLNGDLGVGKTFFARGFIKELCGQDTIVRSPSFPILQTYKSKDGIDLFHYDFYRLGSPDEIYNLDIEHALSEAIVLVEWSSVAEELLNDLFLEDTNLIKLDIKLGEDGISRNILMS